MSHHMFDIASNVAIVTGGGRGLGAALAAGFAEAGARVVIGDVLLANAQATAAQIREHGGAAVAAQCDITDPTQVQALIYLAMQTYGGLEILVNNAGINVPKPATDLTLDEWNRIIGVKMTG